MDSITEDDVERVERDHVDPHATREAEIQAALSESGIQGNSNEAFRSLMATSDDVTAATDTSARITTREDVERGLEGVDKPRSGERDEALVSDAAREVGAPRESDVQRARTMVVAQADQVDPTEIVEGTESKTAVQVIRDEGGDPVAATGGYSEEIGREVADEIGAEYLSTEQVVDEMATEGSGSTVDLTLRGRRVGEVGVE